MNKKVQKALTALKDPSRLIMESRESVIVYKDDLDALIAWVEKHKGLDDEIQVGDTVEVLVSTALVKKGEVGIVTSVDSNSFTRFPCAVNMGFGIHGKFALEELRKVEDNEH